MLNALNAGGARSWAMPEAIIGSIYDEMVDGASLQGVVDVLRQVQPGAAVVAYGEDLRGGSGNFIVHSGLGRDAERAWMTDRKDDDAYIVGHWKQPVGKVFDKSEMERLGALEGSTLHAEFTRFTEPLNGMCGVVVDRGNGRQIVVEIRYDRHEPHADRDMRLQLETLTPHLIRALELGRIKRMPALEGAEGDAILEFLPLPAFALNSACQVRARNIKAEAMLRRMDSVVVGADGMLHARDANLDLQMKSFTRSGGGEFRKASRCVMASRAADGRRLFASLHSVPPPWGRNVTCFDLSAEESWRCILVLDDASIPLSIDVDLLWKALGLTPAESELAESLLGGSTLGDCAAARSTSKQSMRNLLLSIMRKTDTHRQTQLVSLLTRLAIHAHT